MDIQQSSADRLGKSRLFVYNLETGYGYSLWVSQRGFRLGSIESRSSARQNVWWNTVMFSPLRTLEPGLALLISIVKRIGVRLNTMETVLEVPQQSVISLPATTRSQPWMPSFFIKCSVPTGPPTRSASSNW